MSTVLAPAQVQLAGNIGTVDGEDVDLAGVRGNPGAGTPTAESPDAASPPEPGGDADSVSHASTTPAGTCYRLAAAGACAAVAVAVTAALEPTPGRHVRGLLLVVAVVLALGVSSAWLRVLRALRASSAAPGVE
jgi:hypothetical protein